jgi:hypothetical protein
LAARPGDIPRNMWQDEVREEEIAGGEEWWENV